MQFLVHGAIISEPIFKADSELSYLNLSYTITSMRQNENLEHFDYTHALDSLKKLLREEAGPLVLEFRKNKPMRVRTKETYADILTEADTLSEEIIRGYLQKAYPTHAIFGEEGTDNGGSNSPEFRVCPRKIRFALQERGSAPFFHPCFVKFLPY